MALDNYDDLKAAVLAWPDLQGEQDIEANIDLIIELAEVRINQELQLQRQITSLQVAGSAGQTFGAYLLPDEALGIDRIKGPSGESLTYRPVDELEAFGTEPPEPCFWSIDGNQLVFSPAVSGFTLRYFRAWPSIQSGNNWLWANLGKDAYLYAALISAGSFSKEADRDFSRYAADYEGAIGRILRQDSQARFPKSQKPRTTVGLRGRKQRTA